MDKRNHQREEMVDVLPADKRVCSTSEYKSDSSNLPAAADIVSRNSEPEHLELDMEPSSSLSEQDREEDSSQGEMVENSLSYNQPNPTNDAAPSHSDDLSYSATSRNKGYQDTPQHYDPNSSSTFCPKKGHLKKICSSLKLESSLDIQLSNLTELCDVLSLCTEDSISFSCTESLVPTLIGLAKHDNPEIMLLAIRAFTHICNIMPLSSLFISRHDVVPALCARLMVIEYIDVAEQCLQALEKMSHDHPVVCLRNGAIMAALMYIDFFPTTVQRVALSTVASICRRLPSDSFSSIKDAVPILSNLLHNEDQKVVESAVTCLVSIIKCFSSSNDIDELCKHGLLEQATDAISINSQMALNQQALTGLIGMLSMVACGSAVAAKALLDMNIISSLRDILSTCRFSFGAAYSLAGDVYDQICAVLNLLNELLPALEGETSQILSCKENKLKDQPGVLLHYGMDILPVLIHVVGSGANLSLCYGSLLVMNKLVHYSTSDMLQDMLINKNMCSFLTGVMALKDHHVLIPVLRIIDYLMQKLPKICVKLFVKEGVVAAVDMLLLPEGCPDEKHMVDKRNSSVKSATSVQKTVSNDDRKCLCVSFSAHHSPSSRGICKFDKEMVHTLAKHIKETYFALEMQISGAGLTEKLQRMKALCEKLAENSCLDNSVTDHELYLNGILERLMVELKEGDPLSTFEFIESGIVKSLTNYLGCGKDLKEKIVDHDLLDYFGKVQKRFLFFAQLAFASTSGQWRDLSSAIIVDKLLSALSKLENLPVVHLDCPKSRGSYADIPGRYTSYPCLKVCFVKDEEDKYFHDYSSNVVTVELLTSMDAVEDYLWPLISKNGHHLESINHYMPYKQKVHTTVTEDCSNVSSYISGPQSCVSKATSVSSERTHTMEYVCTPDNGVALQQTVEIGTASQYASPSKQCASNIRDSTMLEKEYAPSKLDFFFHGKLLDSSITLYQAILQRLMQENALISTRLWNEVFQISFKRSFQSERSYCGQEFTHVSANWIQRGVPSNFFRKLKTEFPAEFGMPDPICDVLLLLKAVEGFNRSSFRLVSYKKEKSSEGNLGTFDAFEAITPAIPQSEFVSSKLTEKLEQQLKGPFCVDSRCLPSWCNQLVSEFPFLFSFETRRKYFQLRLSGFLRSKHRSLSQHGSTNNANISNERSHASTVPKKKFQVQRDCILDSALKMMDRHACDEATLEVEFVGEVGTGLGPTLEFYVLVSHEFQKSSISMWRGTNYNWSPINREGFQAKDLISFPHGLFPRPWSLDASHSTDFSEVEKKFLLLGQVVARALQDARILDLPFSKAFLRLVLGQDLDLDDIKSFDPELGNVLEELQAIVGRKKFLDTVGSSHEGTTDLQLGGSRIEDLCLDFTLPGYPDYVLKAGAEHELVSLDSLEEYVSLVVDATVKSGLGRQVEAFKSGFNQVFPIQHLQIFTEDELDRMLCGEQDAWVSEAFLDHVKFDHGYTSSSLPVIHFLEIIREFKHDERSAFLQFVTGAPRLPPGGLAALNPKLTVVRKNSGGNADCDLPSVMTCANYLKLPPYSTKERARERLLYAITEGQGSFHLS